MVACPLQRDGAEMLEQQKYAQDSAKDVESRVTGIPLQIPRNECNICNSSAVNTTYFGGFCLPSDFSSACPQS